jgi:hypothetical protein
MIVFDLECRVNGHRFEGWFGSSDDFAEQQARGLVMCPVCGASDVIRGVSAPHIGRKGNQLPEPVRKSSVPSAAMPPVNAQQANGALPPEALAVLKTIATMQAEALKSSTWVGKRFADDARAMHYGEKDAAPIHGQATPEEAKALFEEGVEIAPILFPLAPPKELN